MRNKTGSKLVGVVLAAAGAMVAPGAMAGDVSGAHVQGVVVLGTSSAYVETDGSASGKPACANTTFPTRFAFDVSTSKGKAILSLASSGMLSGKSVTVWGSNTCTTVVTGQTYENVDRFYLNNW